MMRALLRFLFVVCLVSIGRLEIGAAAQDSAPASPKPSVQPATIAVLPWRFLKGSPKAVRTGREMLFTLLKSAQTTPEPDDRIYSAWQDVTGARFDDKSEDAPTREQMLAVGNKLGVDLVISGSARWRDRTVWVALGPKPKSECIINCLILDVHTGATVLEAKDVKMDDTAREDVVRTVGGTVLSGVFMVNVFSGNDKTPHEQRAVQLALAKALKPFIADRH